MTGPYLDDPCAALKNRGPWLALLLASAVSSSAMLQRGARGLQRAIAVLLPLGTLASCSDTVVVARELAQNVSRIEAPAEPSDASSVPVDAEPAPVDTAPIPPREPGRDAGRAQDGGSPAIVDASLPEEVEPEDDGNPFDID
jgi:hypothetical protein